MNLQTELNFGGVQETSRIAYHENKEGKKRMVEMVVKALKRGYFINRYNHIPVQTLKALEIATGLPSSSCAGRVNDAIKMGLLKYEGDVVFMGRRRKKIVVA